MQILDPEAAKRSLMLKQKALCNGEKTGFRCKHYFFQIGKMDVDNPDHLRKGLSTRLCFVHSSDWIDLGDGGGDLAVECTHFEPTQHAYNPDWESYNPMTTEEVRALEAAHAAAQEARDAAADTDPGTDPAGETDAIGRHLASIGVAEGLGVGPIPGDDEEAGDRSDDQQDDDDGVAP